MLKRYGDIISGLLAATVAAVVYIASYFIVEFNTGGVGSDFVPRVVAGLLFALSLLLIYRGVQTSGILQKKPAVTDAAARTGSASVTAQATAHDAVEAKPFYLGVLASLALMIAYLAILVPLGFILSTIIYLFFQILILTKREERHVVRILFLSVFASVAIYFLFNNGFAIILPKGLMGVL